MDNLTPGQLVDAFKHLTLQDLTVFVKQFEETFDVSAQAPAAVVAPPTAVEEVEEQTQFDVILMSAGENKIHAIKAVREITKLGLKEAKDLVDTTPKQVLGMVSKDAAEDAKAKLEAVGATVELR